MRRILSLDFNTDKQYEVTSQGEQTTKAKQSWEETFMQAAELFAKRSSCVKRQVGAILVKDNRILSTGYNGTVPGFLNCCEVFKLRKPETNEIDFDCGAFPSPGLTYKKITHHEFAEKYEIHAEQNCLAFAAKNGVATDGCTMYVTTAPCVHCAKLIVAAGIKTVVFKDLYKYSDGVDFLNDKTDVKVYKMLKLNDGWVECEYSDFR